MVIFKMSLSADPVKNHNWKYYDSLSPLSRLKLPEFSFLDY